MRMSVIRISLLVALTGAGLAVMAACGDDGGSQSTPAGVQSPAAKATQEPGSSPTLAPRSGDFASLCTKTGTKQFSAPQTVIDSSKKYTALIKTEKGDVTLELYPDSAPVTVNSFVFLACSGYYDNITWHRVLPGFVAQTGDPTGSGSGGPGYEIPDEISALKFEKGSVGMANRGPNTNGSQFFICYEPQPDLDGKYTVFGKVTAGFETLEMLTPRNPQPGSNLPPGDKLLEITVTEE